MRKKIYKLFWAWEFDKEETWLNQMAAKGRSLVSVGFCNYTFEQTAPSEYEIRLELLENVPKHAESEQYIAFLEETGAEHVGSLMRWVYFRKKKSAGSFDLYSDNDSRIAHLSRILNLIGIITLLELGIGLNGLIQHLRSSSPFTIGWAVVPLAFGMLIGIGFLRVYRLREKLKKEKQLFE